MTAHGRAACAASVVAWARSATAALEPACGAGKNHNTPLPAPPCSKKLPGFSVLGQGPACSASPGENGARREKLRNHPQNSRGLVFRRGGSQNTLRGTFEKPGDKTQYHRELPTSADAFSGKFPSDVSSGHALLCGCGGGIHAPGHCGLAS
jgi:hypothetical protein